MGLETGTYISDLNQANPDGATDLKSEGDDHLRLIKKTILNSFPNISGAMNASHTELNHNVGVTGRVGGGTVLDSFASGTIMAFQQTAAPTGWTKETTHNDKGLRVVTGAAGSGGTDPFTTTFSAAKATEDYTLLIADIPSHDHDTNTGVDGNHRHDTTLNTGTAGSTSSDNANGQTVAIYTGYAGDHSHTITAEGGGGGHAHDITMDLQYVDLILAAKD